MCCLMCCLGRGVVFFVLAQQAVQDPMEAADVELKKYCAFVPDNDEDKGLSRF